MKLKIFLLTDLSFLVLLLHLFIPKAKCYVYMCWYVSWSETRDELPFSADYIDYDLCSHLIYSAALVDPNTFDIIFMQKDSHINMHKILNSKKAYDHLKVILTIGSYDTMNFGFDSISNPKNTEAIEKFCTNLVKFLRQYNFDGVLVDYEFPNMINRGFLPYTKHGFSNLLRSIKEKFREEAKSSGKPELLLLAILAARLDWIDNFYETSAVVNYLDYMLLLTYDLKSSSEKRTRITSALFPLLKETGFESTLNVFLTKASSVAKWITEGAKAEKIVIGIPAYGRTYELTFPNNLNNPGAPINGPGLPGPITEENGVLSYFEICDKILSNNSLKMWQAENLSPYLIFGDKYWVGYDDTESIYQKMLFVKANNLSGAFLWTMDLDDFRGDHCGEGRYPLLNAIKSELLQVGDFYEDLYDFNRSASTISSRTICIHLIILYLSAGFFLL